MAFTTDQNAAALDFWNKNNNSASSIMQGMQQYGVNYKDMAGAIGQTPDQFAHWLNLNGAPQGFAGLDNSNIYAERAYNQQGRMNEVANFIGMPLSADQKANITNPYTAGATPSATPGTSGPTNGPTFGGGAAPSQKQANSGVNDKVYSQSFNSNGQPTSTSYGANLGYTSGQVNPYLQPQADAIRGQYTRALNEDVMPTINQGAVAAGGYGGSRHALAQGKAINGMGLNLASALSSMYGNSYQFDQGNFTNQRGQDMSSQATNRGLDQSGMQLGANLYNMGNQGYLGQGQGLYQVGTTQQNAPWQQLQNLSGLTGPYTGLNSTSTVNGNSSGSTLGNIVGGALMGNKIYNGWGTGSGGMAMVNGGGFSNLPAYLLG